MRRGARGCAATAMRTLRDFMTPALWVICSTASEGRSRRWSRARARSGVRAGSEARARSSGADAIDEDEASDVVSDWECSGFIGTKFKFNSRIKNNCKVKSKRARVPAPHNQNQIKINNEIKSDGQECPSYIWRARRRAPSTGSTIFGWTCTP